MRKPLLFYMIDEHMDVEKYCTRKGLIPYKSVMKVLDGRSIEQIIQYIKGDFVYLVLDGDLSSYTGCMFTLVRQPELSYEELLIVALTSRYFDERAGAIGTILKDYSKQFRDYLLGISQTDINTLCDKKNIKRMIKFINRNTYYAYHLEEILQLCKELYSNLNEKYNRPKLLKK